MNTGRAIVSTNLDVQLELFRVTSPSASVWLPDQCFELVIKSPYPDPSVYETFKPGQAPTCEHLTTGLEVKCNVKAGTTDTL